ncbi:hypothetical protein CAPTEDRAFT_182691 [Capitella teleta]|uniref:Large ribosomal subunit protein uL4m n=1 Tax=Capitella teleta TaxID=283909 RepID=R7VDD0_CAPTE|nr:hypothetical protein CAPTEDRAFT_138537 [Capitella teleta]ELU16577.1 hypothetical protein CAPTEDRAFT_182691 [Capitella teleta]|eukprot:ELU14082.1 hypothetical protein CAPTEDRAFT_138537 [Capitella teleta]
MTSRPLGFIKSDQKPKQAWLETLSSIENEKLGIIDLHPEVFAVFPRIDILHENIHWQRFYRKIDYTKQLSRAELWGGTRKPWQQKGTGKARHGSNRSPLWFHGGKSFGPRGPKSYFYMLPTSKRVLGLATALSVKYAQNNLHIVDSLEIPSSDPEYLEELIETRGWGLSVLFINEFDIIPENIGAASEEHKPYNIMAAYGLNVYSMLKHETLVLTLPALEHIEKSLLAHMHSHDARDYPYNKKNWHQYAHPLEN